MNFVKFRCSKLDWWWKQYCSEAFTIMSICFSNKFFTDLSSNSCVGTSVISCYSASTWPMHLTSTTWPHWREHCSVLCMSLPGTYSVDQHSSQSAIRMLQGIFLSCIGRRSLYFIGVWIDISDLVGALRVQNLGERHCVVSFWPVSLR